MINPFAGDGISDLYKNKDTLKWVVLGVAIIISLASIFFTNALVKQLKEREKKYIELFANALEYTANEQNSENLTFLFIEIITANQEIPLIMTDGDGNPMLGDGSYRNIDIDTSFSKEKRLEILKKEIELMKEEHDPIVITYRDPQTQQIYDYNYIYYKNSALLYELKYYPYVLLSAVIVFSFLAYLAFSYSRRAEQNRVWVGMAKETAHQLGTPLSSLMAWVEYFKTDPKMKGSQVIEELDKDIHKLELITSRFSNIGSIPVLKEENLYEAIKASMSYLEPRLSSKVNITVSTVVENTTAKINRALFDWVIENISKNAVDAMGGVGDLKINIIKASEGRVFVDISDNGKGIPKAKIKRLFEPGFTTKKRGWGLGLTLVKRIIEQYHGGRIFVKFSEVDVGTTFRIVLGK